MNTVKKSAARYITAESPGMNEATLRGILDAVQDSIWLFNSDGIILMANEIALSRMHRPAEEIIGVYFGKLMPEELARPRQARLNEVIETGLPVEFEDERAGIIFHHHFYPVEDADGRVIQIVAFSRDITERKRAEAEQARLASFPERNPNPVFEVGYSGDIVYLNPKSRELFPDLASFGLKHPILAGLEPLIQKFKTGELELVLTQEVKAGDGYYLQTAVNIPESERIRLYNVDITSLKRAEETLRESEQRFRIVLQNAPIVVANLDRELRYTWIHNPRGGFTPEDILGKTVGLSTDPKTTEKIFKSLRQVVADGTSAQWDTKSKTKLGELYYESHAEPLKNANGEITGVALVSIDITERKQAEAALLEATLQKQASQYARTLLEVSLDPLVTISAEGKITDVNEAAVKATGVPRAELVGTDFANYFTEHDQAEQGYRQVFAQGYVIDYPLTIRHRDGRLMDVLYNASLYKDADGKVLGIFAAARDVTVQKQASQYSRSLLEASLDPLVTISPAGKITDVNEAAVKATGVSRQELVGADFSRYFTDPDQAEQGYRQVFAQGYVTDYPLTIRHRDGRLMDVLYNASLYKDTHGSVLGIFAAARDVTVQKQAEAELKRHKENLELLVSERTASLEESNRELARSNENLEQFAYVASHDLQEPLRVMSSYSQLLERRYRGKLDQDADDFIDFIVDAAARMQKLITDLLAYSRAGREKTDIVEVDCNRVLRKLVAGMAATIESADGSVTFDHLPVIPAHESSLIQLFQNLIGNALKFRGEQPPSIHVSARQVESEWVFSVRDNGIGLEPQYRERIFMIFQRLHPRDKYPGTGIGLSICKKIVENLGGRIWVESDPGQGSTFTFTVPIRK